MKPSEIIGMALFVVLSFVTADCVAENIVFAGAFQRFILRIGIQALFLAILYLYYESRDYARRIKNLEDRDKGADTINREPETGEGR